jgi:hypothetical protein
MKKLTIVLWSICAVILYMKTGYLKLLEVSKVLTDHFSKYKSDRYSYNQHY